MDAERSPGWPDVGLAVHTGPFPPGGTHLFRETGSASLGFLRPNARPQEGRLMLPTRPRGPGGAHWRTPE